VCWAGPDEPTLTGEWSPLQISNGVLAVACGAQNRRPNEASWLLSSTLELARGDEILLIPWLGAIASALALLDGRAI